MPTVSTANACAVTSMVRSAAVLMMFAGVVVLLWLLGMLPCAGQLLRKRLQYIPQ